MNSSMNGKLLEIRDLSAGYSASVNIINDITMWVEDGEILTLIGPNGAGKSTLIKCLCGLLRYSSGSILFKQKEINGLKTHQIISQSIAYVPQTNSVFLGSVWSTTSIWEVWPIRKAAIKGWSMCLNSFRI